MAEASPTPGQNGEHSSPTTVAVATVGVVYAVNDNYVVKRRLESSHDFARQAFSSELQAYERLGNHPRIAIVRETTGKSIVLERGECLRWRFQSQTHEAIALRTRLRWAQEAADGLRYVHD
ncbi:hypothetical protein BDW62DRAFT_197272 [Aspergillus aurantiobrunneus]